MKSTFKELYDTLVTEAKKGRETEAQKITQGIADIRATYGDVAGDEIEKLLELVHEYAKKLKDLKELKVKGSPENKAKRIKRPDLPKVPEPGNYKSKKGYEKAMAKYPEKLKKHRLDTEEYYRRLQELNNEKLNAISGIANEAGDYNVPDDGSCQLEYVMGNSKVGDDTIIINMGPATSCDAAKAGECELYSLGFCYAQNNETQHKLAIVKRFREQLQWKTDNTGSTIATQLAAVIEQKRKGTKYVKFVRFNESGDMNSDQDKKKLGKIVEETNEILERNGQEPVVFYTYTHRTDLFPGRTNDIDNSPALVIQGSGFFKESGKKRTPFFVDNCFMGIDYPNLIDLVRNGNFEQLTEPEDEDNEGRLGIDFEGEKPRVVICKGACFGCQWCKTKGARFLILVAYHGSGTKIKTASGQMTSKLGTLAADLGELLDKENLPPEVKREIYDIGHFNEYLIADRLVGYASHKGSKGYREPLMDWSSIAPLILDIRELALRDQREARKNWKPGKGNKFAPQTYGAGSRFSSDKEMNDYIAAAKRRDDNYLAKLASGETVEDSDEDFEESVKDSFDATIRNALIVEAKPAVDGLPPIGDMTIDDIRNMAVANKLVQHKDYVSPDSVQKLLDDNGYDIDVTGDDVPEEPYENWDDERELYGDEGYQLEDE